MNWCRIGLPLSLLLVPACGGPKDGDDEKTGAHETSQGDEASGACTEEHSVESGGTFETDDHHIICLNDDCPPTTVPDIVAECSDNGITCDASLFITRQAAICLADAAGLEEGIAPWLVSMAWGYSPSRPVWIVDNTLEEEGCTIGGHGFQVDMETGDIVDESWWEETCDAEASEEL